MPFEGFIQVFERSRSLGLDKLSLDNPLIVFVRILQLLTTTVQEDGYELSMTVTFALRGGRDKFTGKKLGITGDYLSFHTDDNQTTYRSDSDGKFSNFEIQD